MNRKTISIRRIYHREQFYLGLFFPYDRELIQFAKKIGAQWSRTHQCWLIADKGNESLEELLRQMKGVAFGDYKALNSKLKKQEIRYYYQKHPLAPNLRKKAKPKSKEADDDSEAHRKALIDAKIDPVLMDLYNQKLIRRRYSASTLKTYTHYFKRFLRHIHPKKADEIDFGKVEEYILYLVQEKQIAQSTQGQIINAIKFYYEHVLGYERRVIEIDRPRKEKKLPEIISKEEVLKILQVTQNLKHKSILALLYSAGLRRGELLNLHIEDIQFERKQVYVRGGKGKKDRVTILSDQTAVLLRKYLMEYKPNYWLFEGVRRKQYSGMSVGKILTRACKNAQVKRITPHILRHSFATHLMDDGVDTRVIQKLLGHESLETTAIYTHVSTQDLQKIKSPLDGIMSGMSLFTGNSEDKE